MANVSVKAPKISIKLLSSVLAFFVFLTALTTFTADEFYSSMISMATAILPISGLIIEAILIVFIFAVLFLDMGNESKQKTVMYVSWALYAPSALYCSRFDILKALGIPVNFGIFSSTLPAFVVIAAGILIICGHLMTRSLNNMASARESFISRGASAKEVDNALNKNIMFEAVVMAVSVVIVLAVMLVVPMIEPSILGILRSTQYAYILAGIAAVIILALTIVAYAWPTIK